MTDPMYAEYKRLEALYVAKLHACDHADKVRGHRGEHFCDACWLSAQPLRFLAELELKCARKAWRDAQPRCEVPGCGKRAAWNFPHGVGVCGKHKGNIKRAHASLGISAMLCGDSLTREVLLAWASGEEVQS